MPIHVNACTLLPLLTGLAKCMLYSGTNRHYRGECIVTEVPVGHKHVKVGRMRIDGCKEAVYTIAKTVSLPVVPLLVAPAGQGILHGGLPCNVVQSQQLE